MNLENWIDYINSLHVVDMDLSLERVIEVARRLDLLKPENCIITVAGTNGKGSCVAGLEAIYLAAGYRVGAFTSPFLFRYNEYVRIQGKEAADDQFCTAFERIENVRNGIPLTIFEFTTLAAFIIFKESNLDIVLLEVGLGGRYDAVNVLDADVAIVTSIGIDHVEWLGDTREKIAYQKAGIFRTGKPAIYGDQDPPESLIQYAHELKTPLYRLNKEFEFNVSDSSWFWKCAGQSYADLPLRQLAPQNLSTVLMAVELLRDRYPVSSEVIYKALDTLKLPGRIEVVEGEITQIFDVSHNPAGAAWLANWLAEHPIQGKTRAVFSMLKDKDIPGTLEEIKNHIHEWHISELKTKRAATIECLKKNFEKIKNVISYSTVSDAYQAALHLSTKNDRVIIFGSFHTVAEVKNDFFIFH